MNLNSFFNPKSIAIVGASGESGKVGNVIAKNVLELGYRGKVFLINPKHREILEKRCYKNLSEIKDKVDLAIAAIPAKLVTQVVSESAEQIKNWVIISSGFSETGEEGIRREEELKKIARDKNLNILGPNCLGFIVPKLKLNASFAGGMPEIGGIALISQSGALAVGMMDAAKVRGMRFSKIISIGNKMTLSETELLNYLGQDKDTKVVGMYLEGIKKGDQFIKIAREVSQKKPVIVIKAGKTEMAQKAISSHTGALAEDAEIIKAVFKKTGILQAETLESFFNLLSLASLAETPLRNKEAVIVTNAGGPGVLAADAFYGKTIKLADINLDIKRKLKSFLPKESSVENPIDLLGDAQEDRYKKTLEIINKYSGIGAIICVLTPQDQTPVEKIAQVIINFKKRTSKIIATVFIGEERVKRAVKKLEENNIVNFSFPEAAVLTLDAFYQWDNSRKIKPVKFVIAVNKERIKKIAGIINQAKREKRKALYFTEAKEIMASYGINAVNCLNINSVSKFPVVLKVDSDKVLHKTEKKGLILDIKNQKELGQSLAEMRRNFPGKKLIVQPMMERKVELILGIKHDPAFGPVIICGLGGIYTEVFKTVDFFIPPLDIAEVKENLLKGKISFLFRKTRGQKPYKLDELARILVNVSRLAQETSEISELDINPLLVYNDGRKATAVDMKIVL